jgi:hypothetical protein
MLEFMLIASDQFSIWLFLLDFSYYVKFILSNHVVSYRSLF